MENFDVPASNYGYTAVKPDELEGSTNYTLVTLAVDKSGSVASFANELEKVTKEVIHACKYSPMADNLMLRVLLFDNNMTELHGYKLLSECVQTDYDNLIKNGGSTALFDTCQNAIAASADYANKLKKMDYIVNGIFITITDGEDNMSTLTMDGVKKELDKISKNEAMESLMTILVGCNTSTSLSTYLQNFKDRVGFTQYVDIGKADSKTLAKLSKFISKSITSQSRAIGSGGVSQSITF